MNGPAPLVSVIIATYNWSSVLRYAIASVQRQTFNNFELLVIGDGCTDDSAEVVASFHDPRFHWENLPKNTGHQSAANNKGLDLARGKWIAYLGHDDLWVPNHLELLLQEAGRAKADVAFSLTLVIGAPECGGRKLFGAFARGQYNRGAHLPPSALLHRKSLVDQWGNWSDYRTTEGSPETAFLERFFDGGARFAAVSEISVFKFPSSWRPMSYRNRSCAEQADFFQRMQNQPDFLQHELLELALAQELLKPHTTMAPAPPENDVVPGAMVTSFRRNRGLTSETPEVGPGRYIPSPSMWQMILDSSAEEIRRQQASRFALFEVLYAEEGRYGGARFTRTLVPIGRWSRVRIPLEYPSEGAPLRIDPCEQPALIQIAWLALRRGGKIEWSLRGQELATLGVGGDAVRLSAERTLVVRSRGHDPILFLPADAVVVPPSVLYCWIKIAHDE